MEDHADTRDALAQVPRHHGAPVTTAAAADEALPAVPRVDVVVTDIVMPEQKPVDVWQLSREIAAIVLRG